MKITLKGHGNETFTVTAVQSLVGICDNIADLYKDSGKETSTFTLTRNIEGTRKVPYTVQCFRFIESGNYAPVF